MSSGFCYINTLDRSVSSRRGVWLFLSLSCFIESPVSNASRVNHDQTSRSVASDLGLHFFASFSFKGR